MILVAAVADRNREAARARLARIETLRSEGAKRTDGDTHD